MKKEKYIRFDWAMKRLLRNKANYSVLEGFLTTLLGHSIKIRSLLESESNLESPEDKGNRVDMLAENENGELFLVEIQNNNETAYFQRMLFGTSKLVTEYINRGDNYDKVRKIYSINIVYFPLGAGSDYIYHGKTEFRGMNSNELLELSPFQRQKFNVDAVSELYPEYYILKVNDFNKGAKSPLEEWIYYLNTGEIPDGATAPGLDGVREHLKLGSMSKEELRAYYRHLDNLVILHDCIFSSQEEARFEGMAKGLAEGRAEGRAEGIAEGRAAGIAEGRAAGIVEGRAEGIAEGERKKQLEIARAMRDKNFSFEDITAVTGITAEELS